MLQLFVYLLLFGKHCGFHTLLLNYLSFNPLNGFHDSLSTVFTKDSLSECLVKYIFLLLLPGNVTPLQSLCLVSEIKLAAET